MENTILVNLSRQITLQRKMDTIANNLANMNTAGFKSDEVKFEEYLSRVAKDEGFNGADKQVSFVTDPHMVRNLAAGTQRQTGNELDIALSGDGFLVVNTPAGERYSRNGQLKLTSDGTLVTNEGHPVQGDGGPITVEPGETNIVIGKDGTFSTSAGVKDRLRVVEFANPQALHKRGSSLYEANEPPTAAANTTFIQGSYESSNVNSMIEMTNMIETVRAYSSASRMIEAADETKGKAIQQLGRPEG